MDKKRFERKKEYVREFNTKENLAKGDRTLVSLEHRYDTAKRASGFSSDYMFAGNSKKGRLDVKKGDNKREVSIVLKAVFIVLIIFLVAFILIIDLVLPISDIVLKNNGLGKNLSQNNAISVSDKSPKVMLAFKEVSKKEYMLLDRQNSLKELIKNDNFSNKESKEAAEKSLDSIEKEINQLKSDFIENTEVNTKATMQYRFSYTEDEIIKTSQYIFETKDLEILSKERILRAKNKDFAPVSFTKVGDVHRAVYNYIPYIGVKLSTAIEKVNDKENITKYKFRVKENDFEKSDSK